MYRSRRMAYALPALSLLFVPQPANAGPIPVGVRVEILGITLAPGEPADPGQVAFAPAAGGGPIATVRFTPYFSGPGAGGYADQDWQSGVSNYVTAESRFTVAVQITNEASGQVGEAAVTGVAHAEWFHRWDGDWRPNLAWVSQAGGPGELTLGGGRYELRIDGIDAALGDPVSADVTIQFGPASATPEPGTLALAGLGLGAVGLARARRRRGLARSS